MTKNNKLDDLYPCIIVSDRYSGTYSGGNWLAFNLRFVPDGVDDGDVECHDFWSSYKGIVGKGDTPDEALSDLRNKLFRQGRKRAKTQDEKS